MLAVPLVAMALEHCPTKDGVQLHLSHGSYLVEIHLDIL